MTGSSRRPDLRVLAPALLLAAVALRQIWLASTASLSPWKGGGFGMFAAVDGAGWRGLRVFVEGGDRHQEVELTPRLETLAAKAQALPSRRLLSALAREVAAREARQGRPVSRVRIEVTGTSFDPATLAATVRPLARHEQPIVAGEP